MTAGLQARILGRRHPSRQFQAGKHDASAVAIDRSAPGRKADGRRRSDRAYPRTGPGPANSGAGWRCWGRGWSGGYPGAVLASWTQWVTQAPIRGGLPLLGTRERGTRARSRSATARSAVRRMSIWLVSSRRAELPAGPAYRLVIAHRYRLLHDARQPTQGHPRGLRIPSSDGRDHHVGQGTRKFDEVPRCASGIRVGGSLLFCGHGYLVASPRP